MAITAVTVSYQTGPVLRDCLDALIAAPEIGEIVLVDNGNPADVEAWLDQRALAEPRLKLTRGQGNIGFGAACNAGAKRASGDVLLFVNPDVILGSETARAMLAALDRTQGPALIGGDVRDAAGNPDRGTRRDRVTLWSAFVSFSGLSRLERISPAFRDLHRHGDPLPKEAAEFAHVSGALMMMRRADFERLGGFDEAYFLHVEDIDLCWRVTQAGGHVLFQPGAIGTHARSSSQVASREVETHKASGFARFFLKTARSPLERFMAGIVGNVLKIVLPARAA